MKRLILLSVLALSLAALPIGLGTAFTCGQDGATPADDFGNCDSKHNQVQCTGGTSTPAGRVYAGPQGVQGCNDGSGAFPVQGRVGVSASCQCVYVDGDEDDRSITPYATGWARVDAEGYHCQAPGQQSYNSSGADRGTVECLPVHP